MRPKSTLPKWLAIAIVALFCAHYSMILVNHFSKYMLPKSLYYATNRYLSPWFYQNLTAFAPDPPFYRHVFVYRLKVDDEWTKWNNPARKYLLKTYENRFSTAAKTHDQLEAIGDYLYRTAKRPYSARFIHSDKGVELPAVISALKVIRMDDEKFSVADSFQVGVYIEHLRVDEGLLTREDSALTYPKYPRIDLD